MTDKVLLDDSRHVLTIMQGLKALGVQLLIDDFGTGYSALQCLQTFPLDGLKIDSSFIARLNHNDAGRSIVEAIVDLGHALSLRVVAEGVQAAEQFGVLRDIQCDEVQGPHLSPPLDQEALLKLYGEAPGPRARSPEPVFQGRWSAAKSASERACRRPLRQACWKRSKSRSFCVA